MIETQGSCSLLAVAGTVSGFTAVFTRLWHGQTSCERWQYSVCLDSHGETVQGCGQGVTFGLSQGVTFGLSPRPSEQTRLRTAEVGAFSTLSRLYRAWLATTRENPSSPRLGSPGDRRRKHCVLERVATTPIRGVGMRGFCEMP
jgi:hypothetical protein